MSDAMMSWGQVGALIGTIIAVVGVPLGYMTRYLKHIAADQARLRNEHESLERRVGYVERDYTTKEEWVREAALMRQKLDTVTSLLVTMQAESGLVAQFTRMTEAITSAVQSRDNQAKVRT